MTTGVFIVGCGDIGLRVARRCQAEDRTVRALARSDDSARRLRTAGIEPVAGDLDAPLALTALPVTGRIVFYLVPPPAGGDSDPRMAAFLTALDGRPARIVYISTTGVYGDARGEWVTEDTPAHPTTPRARRRWDAECALHRYAGAQGVEVVILRVPGIYGPGRLPVEAIRSGRAVLAERDAPYSNRIHADDLAAVCMAAAVRGVAGAVYNVSDGRPGSMTQYFNAVADALAMPRPPQVARADADGVLTPAMLSFLDESRRVDNRRMREELGVVLRYPDFESGIRASLPPGH